MVVMIIGDIFWWWTLMYKNSKPQMTTRNNIRSNLLMTIKVNMLQLTMTAVNRRILWWRIDSIESEFGKDLHHHASRRIWRGRTNCSSKCYVAVEWISIRQADGIMLQTSMKQLANKKMLRYKALLILKKMY